MKLIDKDALVAEINKLRKTSLEYGYTTMSKVLADTGKDLALGQLLHNLDTLKVIEVDLDSDIRTYLTNHFNIYEDGVLQSKESELPLNTYDIIKVANYFFELGMRSK